MSHTFFDTGFRDQPLGEYQEAGTIERDFNDVVDNIKEFERVTNENDIPYWPTGPNSNSYASTLVESLTGNRPKPANDAPGWDDGSPDPDLSYDPSEFSDEPASDGKEK